MKIIKIKNCNECPYMVLNIFDQYRCTLLNHDLPFSEKGVKSNIYQDCPLKDYNND